jgi:hypothetical protein
MKIVLLFSILCLINASTAQWPWNSNKETTPSENVNEFIENNFRDESVTNTFGRSNDESNVYIDEHGNNHNEDMMSSTTKEPAIVYPYDPNEDRNRVQPQPQQYIPEPDYRAVDMRGLIKLIQLNNPNFFNSVLFIYL